MLVADVHAEERFQQLLLQQLQYLMCGVPKE